MVEEVFPVEIVKMRLSDIISPAYNPKEDIRENPEDYEQLHNSIQRFGYASIITVNKRNNHIVGGNQRYKLICDMVESKKKDPKEVIIAVQLVNLNDAEEKAANSALNHIGVKDDDEKLSLMLKAIEEDDSGLLELTGFDGDEVKKLMDKLTEDDGSDDIDKEQKDVEAFFEATLNIPHDYFELYQDYVKSHSDAPLVSAIIKVIMGADDNHAKR